MKHQQLFFKLQLVLQSKIEEFKFLKYDTITAEQLWTYCIEKKWRKKNVEELAIHTIVATLFSVTPSEVFAYLKIYEQDVVQNGFVPINLEELEALLGPYEKKQ